jgi:8-oxo-dGTP diphosphatase
VEDLTAGLGAQGQRWLATALAVLAEDLENTTKRDPRLPGSVTAVTVVAGPAGVLAGRRRDGDPPWVLPAATVGPGEVPAQVAVRACKEQTGLEVRVEREIGRCRSPVTGRQVIYLECTTMTCAALRAPCSKDLVELRWLTRGQVDDLIPDLPQVVGCFLQSRYILDSPDR